MIQDTAPTNNSVEIDYRGRKLQLDPLDTADFARIGERLAANRPDLVKLTANALASVPEEMRTWMWAAALKEAAAPPVISMDEMLRWIGGSLEGMGYALFLRLEKRYPGEFDMAATYEILQQLLLDGLGQLNGLAAGRPAPQPSTGADTATPLADAAA